MIIFRNYMEIRPWLKAVFLTVSHLRLSAHLAVTCRSLTWNIRRRPTPGLEMSRQKFFKCCHWLFMRSLYTVHLLLSFVTRIMRAAWRRLRDWWLTDTIVGSNLGERSARKTRKSDILVEQHLVNFLLPRRPSFSNSSAAQMKSRSVVEVVALPESVVHHNHLINTSKSMAFKGFFSCSSIFLRWYGWIRVYSWN